MSAKGKKKIEAPSVANKKSIAERLHAKHRIKKRLGIEVNRDKLRALSKLIQDGKYIEAQKQTNKRTKIRMIFPDTDIEVIVIYDRKTKNVVTVWKHEEKLEPNNCQE